MLSAPAAPETITLHGTDILTANISWTPPPDVIGGDPETTNLFDEYEIYVTEDLANDEDEVKEYVAKVAKDEDLTYIVTGLKPATNYSFEVGTVLYAADQFPTQRSDGNPTARSRTGAKISNLNDEVIMQFIPKTSKSHFGGNSIKKIYPRLHHNMIIRNKPKTASFQVCWPVK